jgi:two-component system sensor histidine kinase MtrB
VARAEHEIRGALCALRLALDAGGSLPGTAVAAQFDRVAAGLAELRPSGRVGAGTVSLEQLARDSVEAWRPVARGMGREVTLEWTADSGLVDAGRQPLAQMTGNLIANALEHGRGRVQVIGGREGSALTLAVRSGGSLVRGSRRPGRGLGLSIASRAARRSGGALRIASDPESTTATIRLPSAGT